AVFVPGALSPMTGLLLVVEEDKVTDAPMSIEDAMKLVFSGGLVVPTTKKRERVESGEPEIAPAKSDDRTVDHLTRDVPLNLPRAEDFDFGDPDILASTTEIEAGALSGSGRRGWASVLPWRRRS
ncbi:MAG TPA: hypothetical protein PKD63_11845, partial [Solirubrobacteraceae bacterium]|nr:hypothetical protein [Solirubrobacteraceae bacterium]